MATAPMAVAGVLRCQLELTSRGDPGQPPPPSTDPAAFLTFCNTAKDQVIVEAG